LLDALIRKAEELAGVPHAQTQTIDEELRRSCGRALRVLSPTLGPRPRSSAAPDRLSRVTREANLLHKLRGFGVLDPEAERLTNSSTDLVKCPPVRVAATYSRNVSDPGTAFVSFDDNAIRLTAHLSSVLDSRGFFGELHEPAQRIHEPHLLDRAAADVE
jgi:hypothetical protein